MTVANLQAIYEAAYLRHRALFFQALEINAAAIDPFIDMFAMVMQSTTREESYSFSDQVPAMKQWLDERPMSRLRVQNFRLENLDFANGIEIDRNDLMDDRIGLHDPRIRSLAEGAARHRLTQLRGLFNDGFANLGYDGQPFFSDTHPRSFDGGTQSNKETDVLDADSFKAAVTKLHTITDEEGEYLQNQVTHLIVGSDLWWTAKALMENERDAAGATNVLRGAAMPVELKGLAAGTWFVADLSKAIKPYINQKRAPVQFVAAVDPTLPHHFHQKMLEFGADYRGNMGYAMWQLVVGSDGSTP
jgi:phage major head subunit gpT-like protein